MTRLLDRRIALGALGTAAATAAFSVCGPACATAAATRVVSLELQLTEILVSLGVPPIAAADNALYRRLVGKPELPDSVADLGPIQQPNLEFLQYLAPDVILAPAWQVASNRATLARVAPVESVGSLSAANALDRLDATVRRLAAIVARDAEAVALLARLEAALDAVHGSVSPQPTFLCRFFEDGRHVSMFGAKSVVGAVAQRAGLVNAWTGRQSAFGTALASIEDLARVPEARIVHFYRGAESDRALARLRESPLWTALPMVRRGDVIATPVVHPNGGAASAIRFAGQLTESLAAKPGRG